MRLRGEQREEEGEEGEEEEGDLLACSLRQLPGSRSNLPALAYRVHTPQIQHHKREGEGLRFAFIFVNRTQVFHWRTVGV